MDKKMSKSYAFARGTVNVLLHVLAPFKVYGREKLLRDGPIVLICNHHSFMDPALLAVLYKKRQVTFLAKKELFQGKLTGKILRGLGAIPVDRGNSDMTAMRRCMQTLRHGEILGIFPEGTRHHTTVMEQIESGTALLALRGNAPLQPVLIEGKLRFFHMNRVFIGNPFDLKDLAENGIDKEACEKATRRIIDVYRDEMIPMTKEK